MYGGKRKQGREPKGLRGKLNALLSDPKFLLIAGLLCATPFAVNLAKRSGTDFTSLPQYQVERDTIQLRNVPDFVPDDLLDRTWQRAGLDNRFSLLQPGLAKTLGDAFVKSPWVRSVKSIRLCYPNRIQIDLVYRNPAALVQLPQGYYPIDRDGILLPPMDFPISHLEQFPIITGVRTLPRGPAGTHWGDLSVWGAAQLAEMFQATSGEGSIWKDYGFASIQVGATSDYGITTSEDLQQVEYRIIAADGSEVIWGVAPEIPDPTEPNAETKLKRLAMYLRDFGGLQTAQGPLEIDLRRWKEIARRPLPNRETATR